MSDNGGLTERLESCGLLAAGLIADRGEGEAIKELAHVVTGHRPHAEQHALALVVACPVGVGFAKIADGDWAIDGADDVGEANVLGRSGQNVPATDTTFGANEPRALECKQDLLKVGLGEPGSLRYVTHRSWASFVGMKGEGEQSPTRIVPSGRNSHKAKRNRSAMISLTLRATIQTQRNLRS